MEISEKKYNALIKALQLCNAELHSIYSKYGDKQFWTSESIKQADAILESLGEEIY